MLEHYSGALAANNDWILANARLASAGCFTTFASFYATVTLYDKRDSPHF